MYFIDYLRMALKNISKKKLRFSISVLSVSIGIMTVVFITTAGNSGLYSIDKELSKMGVNCGVIQSVSGNLTNEEIKSVQISLNKDYYTPTVIKTNGTIDFEGREKECVIYGGDEEIITAFGYNILSGRNIRLSDLINHSKTVIIDSGLSSTLFDTEESVGMKLLVESSGARAEFTVVGVTDSSAVKNKVEEIPAFIFAPHTTVTSLFGEGLPKTIYTLSRGEGESNIKTALEQINGKKHLVWKNMNVYKENINYIINIITLILSLIGAISFAAGGLGVINTMMLTVSERKEEIAIKKALGQTDLSVVFELICEAVITMLFACAFGIVLGMSAANISLRLAGIEFMPDYKSVVTITFISLMTGIVFGFLPAIKTFFMNPVDILK